MHETTVQSRILPLLYAAPLKTELWQEALTEICALLDVHKAVLLDHRTHLTLSYKGECLREGGRLYAEHFWAQDEWTKRFQSRRIPTRVVTGEEVWTERELRSSSFYNEFLIKMDICQVAAVMTRGDGEFETFGFYRGPTEPPFENRHLDLLKMLTPHVEIALNTRRRLRELQSRVDALDETLERIQGAIVVLNHRARVLFANPAAQRILNKNDGLIVSNGSLACSDSTRSSELQALIRWASAGAEGRIHSRGRAVAVPRRTGHPLQILAVPLVKRHIEGPSNACVLLSVSDPDARLMLPAEHLRDFFGLTRAESILCTRLLKGCSLKEAAEELGVGKETVRTQLKAVLLKTGCKNQPDLIRRLLNIVPIAS
jgi:DNA-binding CsgD family transcriptional regulator/PAS domain-containing protein